MKTGSIEVAALAVALAAVCIPASAQLADQAVPALAEVGVEEHLDARLPLEVEFLAEDGRTVRLSDYFDGARPVILTLNYYRCPMRAGCSLTAWWRASRSSTGRRASSSRW